MTFMAVYVLVNIVMIRGVPVPLNFQAFDTRQACTADLEAMKDIMGEKTVWACQYLELQRK